MEFNANVKRFNSEPSNANFLHFCTGFKFRRELDKCPTFSFESAHKGISVEWKTFNHRDIFRSSLLRRIKTFKQNKPFCSSIKIVWTAFSHGDDFYISSLSLWKTFSHGEIFFRTDGRNFPKLRPTSYHNILNYDEHDIEYKQNCYDRKMCILFIDKVRT